MFAEWDGDEEDRDSATEAKYTQTRAVPVFPLSRSRLSGMSNVGVAQECNDGRSLSCSQPRVHVSSTDDGNDIDTDRRPGSATSSLDPYYFGADSPVAHSPNEPLTPARDIDRKGLVGVGELATPRWDKSRQSQVDHSHLDDDVVVVNDPPDSPWTIEAIDGESDEVITTSVACPTHLITFSLARAQTFATHNSAASLNGGRKRRRRNTLPTKATCVWFFTPFRCHQDIIAFSRRTTFPPRAPTPKRTFPSQRHIRFIVPSRYFRTPSQTKKAHVRRV